MIPVKHFYMIRHGQTDANAQKIMAGSLDSPLTELGKNQARNVHNILNSLPLKPRKIIHSNLSRARDTALILNENLNLPLHENPLMAEFDAGEWEGVPYDQCRPLLRDWVDPPGGETYKGFLQRIKTAKTQALSMDEPVMIVSHGGVFRALFKLYDIHMHGVQNCKLYEFTPKDATNNSPFPWDVWRYDHEGGVSRTLVNLHDDPDSEIA